MAQWVRSAKNSGDGKQVTYTLTLKAFRLEVYQQEGDDAWMLSIYEKTSSDTICPSMSNRDLISGQMQLLTKAMELIQDDSAVLVQSMTALHTAAQARRDEMTGYASPA